MYTCFCILYLLRSSLAGSISNSERFSCVGQQHWRPRDGSPCEHQHSGTSALSTSVPRVSAGSIGDHEMVLCTSAHLSYPHLFLVCRPGALVTTRWLSVLQSAYETTAYVACVEFVCNSLRRVFYAPVATA